MAIISSNISESDFPRSNKELRIVDSRTIPEDKLNSTSLSNRPKLLKHFIGQQQLKDSLRISIDASLFRKECLDHILFYGQPGLGKTSLALLMANEMKTQCKATNASSIERPRDIVGLLLGLKENEILFIDEIHRLNKLTEEILYSAMEDFKLDLTVGANRGTRCRTIHLSRFTLIGATTKFAAISSPLRDRFGMCHKINLYSPDDLKEIIQNFSDTIHIKLQDQACCKLARCSRGTPRIAIRLLKRIVDFSVVNDSSKIDINTVLVSLKQMRIDEEGLDEMDRKYLKCISQDYNGGPVGVETLSAALLEQ